jgi:hypothetical protein
MHSDLRAQAAFRLTGLRTDAGISPRLRPALAARVSDLPALRHAFPLVLVAGGSDAPAIELTAVIDRLAEGSASRAPLLRLEREIRVALAAGVEGTLTHVWDIAAGRLANRVPDAFIHAFAAARKKLDVDGELVGCDARFAARLVTHAWALAEAGKTAALRTEIGELLFRLRQVLAAEESASERGRSATRLAEAFGKGGEAFDFNAMAKLLARAPSHAVLGEDRRHRIEELIATLGGARFFTGADHEAYTFERCAPVIRNFQARLEGLRGLVIAIAMARLEVSGAYEEALHGPVFHQLRETAIPADELARMPAYLVCLRWSELDATERADVEALLCAGVPARILLQFDDLLDEQGDHGALRGIGAHAHALAGSALGLDDVFLVQAGASALPGLMPAVRRALAYPGVSVFSVFSGAGGAASLPAYLNAAAAVESRVFPTLVYDPDAGDDGEVSLAGNPQPEADWPVHDLDFEEGSLQRAQRKLAFTAADFVAADARFARHFLPVDRAANEESAGTSSVFMVDDEDRLHELLVDEQVSIHARRCANRWRHLKRLSAGDVPAMVPAPVPAAPAAEVAPATAPVEAAPEPAKTESSDDPFIETPRCTTCNECTQINNRLFAYDANKQAHVADAAAGTYRQLVEAAEACQVSIIHPGKPRNPDEPGLEELLARAQPFL